MDDLKKTIEKMIKQLPEWVDRKKALMLLSGKELVFYKTGKDLKIKKVQCNQCGECCMDFPANPFGHDDEGKCNKLEKEGERWICRAGSDTPKKCLADPEIKNLKELGCSIEYF